MFLLGGGGIILYVSIGYKGYDLYNFILLYLTGRWIALYPKRFDQVRPRRYFVLWVLSVLLIYTLSICWISIGHEVSDKKIFEYSAPWVYFSSVLLFLLFRSKSINWKWISLISPSVLSVYLFHENSWIKQYVYISPLKQLVSVTPNDFLSCVSLLLYGLLLFHCVVIFDKYVRISLQEWILKLLNKLEVLRIIDTHLKKLNE